VGVEATQGEMTSMKPRLRAPSPLFTGGMSAPCARKLRATKVAPMMEFERHGVHWGVRVYLSALRFEPLSAVAENWPLVRPYTAVVLEDVVMFTPRRNRRARTAQADRGRRRRAGHAG